MGRETALFGPAPWDPGRGGQKFKYHLISITSQLKSFLYKALCVFSQMKDTKTDLQMIDTKHIRRDFYSVTLVIPYGGTWVYLGVRN